MNNQNTALLVMDVQGTTVKILPENTPILGSIAKAIQNARSKKIPVIYVVVGFRKGYPEMSPNNKAYAMFKSISMDTEESMRVHPLVAPEPEDVLIVKKRVSAFTGSDLEVVLRSFGIQHLVLLGLSTSGVVLSTVREAADKDYRITVLADCCADRDEEVHRVLTTKVFPRQADVMGVEEWCCI